MTRLRFIFVASTFVFAVLAVTGQLAAAPLGLTLPEPVPPSTPPSDPDAPGFQYGPTPSPPAQESPVPPSCTISGSAAADRLSGRRRVDVICGLRGNDVIRLGGTDVAIGGPGRDRILAANGTPDTLFGGGGRDTAIVDPGIDKLVDIEVSRVRVATTRGFTTVTAETDSAASASTRSPAGLPEDFSDDGGIVEDSGFARDRPVGYLEFGDGGHCSGTLVARNIVLTAAHCIYYYDDSGESEGSSGSYDLSLASGGATFTPHRWGSEEPYGRWSTADAYVFRLWTDAVDATAANNRDEPLWPLDYGLVVLKANTAGEHAGDVAGYYGIEVEYKGSWFRTYGYPSGGYFEARRGYSYFCLSKTLYTDTYYDAGVGGLPYYMYRIACDMTVGASGGPWLVDGDADGTWEHIASVNSLCYNSPILPSLHGDSGLVVVRSDCQKTYGFTWAGPYFSKSVIDLLDYVKQQHPA